MSKKNVTLAIATAAFTFLLLLFGTKTYDIFVLQNPLKDTLFKYHITGIDFGQEKKVTLQLSENSDLRDAVQAINKQIGDVEITLKDNASPELIAFYSAEELYVLQYISQNEYGTLQNYLQKKSLAKKIKVEVLMDNNFLYLKISNGKTALFKMFPIGKEREV